MNIEGRAREEFLFDWERELAPTISGNESIILLSLLYRQIHDPIHLAPLGYLWRLVQRGTTLLKLLLTIKVETLQRS